MKEPRKLAGIEAVLTWLSDGNPHDLDDAWGRRPSLQAIHDAERAGLCFTQGTRVRLTRRGRRKILKDKPEREEADGVALTWPWRWGEERDERGQWVRTACGPSPYPDVYLDVDERELVLQFTFQTLRRVPIEPVIALLRRCGFRIQNPQRKHQRGNARRSRLYPKSLGRSFRDRRTVKHNP